MAKAIIGAHADPRTFALLEEVRSLRARVASLETALEAAEQALAQRGERLVELDDQPRSLEPVDSAIA